MIEVTIDEDMTLAEIMAAFPDDTESRKAKVDTIIRTIDEDKLRFVYTITFYQPDDCPATE